MFGGVAGSGRKTTEPRDVPGFDRVTNATALEVRVHRGGERRVSVTVDDNLQPYLTVSVDDGELVVGTTRSIGFVGEGRVEVTVPRVSAVSVTNSGDVEVDGAQPPEPVTLRVTNSGSLTLCGGMSSLDARTSNSGSLVLCAGDDGPTLSSLWLEVTNSGDIEWRGNAELAEVSTTNSGGIQLAGQGQHLTATARSSGSIDARQFPVRSAELTAAGSGSIRANVNDGTAVVSLSGSGNVEVTGNASIDVRRDSGSGSILRR